MRRAAWLLAALGVLASTDALAKPKRRPHPPRAAAPAPGVVRFLGLDPHGPLAVAKGQVLGSPDGSACRRWGPKGSRWKALDALGQVVGEAEVVAMERYDVTNCDELTLKTRSGKAGVGVFASKGYTPLALGASRATPAERRALEATVAARDAKLPRAQWDKKRRDVPLAERLLAWRTPAGEEIAAVGGRGLTVYRLTGGRWLAVHDERPKPAEVGHADMFRPLAALDMNADGRVEIVIHRRDMDAYGDYTLTPKGKGYEAIDAGIHGAFA